VATHFEVHGNADRNTVWFGGAECYFLSRGGEIGKLKTAGEREDENKWFFQFHGILSTCGGI
jgi:hypothetical protein